MRFHGFAFTDPTYELPVNNEDLAENPDLNAATFGKVHSLGVGPKIPKSESSKGKKKGKFSIRSVLSQKVQKSSIGIDQNESGKIILIKAISDICINSIFSQG